MLLGRHESGLLGADFHTEAAGNPCDLLAKAGWQLNGLLKLEIVTGSAALPCALLSILSFEWLSHRLAERRSRRFGTCATGGTTGPRQT
jgi:hypothetical protein